jgi:hypothetical protein
MEWRGAGGEPVAGGE